MAKRKPIIDDGERVIVSDEEVSPSPSEEAPKAPETTRLVLLKNLKLNYTGAVTGKLYVFDGGGSVLPINVEDVEKMLEKVSGTCCEGSGSNKPQHYFAIA